MSVTPERWAQIKSVLLEAMELPPADRDPFIARSCGEDALLRSEVQSLMRESDGPTPFVHVLDTNAAAELVNAGQTDSISQLLAVALGHQYEIIRELGRGGMGAVYLAREKALERLVAIKVLKPELAASAESRERFRREARIAANLSHPGILQLHTFGEISGVWYFVMSYVRGETLAELLRRRRKLPALEAHQILIELADALTCAHRYHVVHRDIKPANVLIDADSGRAVLADFGISKISGMGDKLTMSGAVLGTPHYMSPEQTLGVADVDERSDIYSLGAVGYSMLCGQEPFTGENVSQLMYARLVRDPVPITELNPAVPATLADAVMKCLARDRLNRWETAEDLKKALVEAASGAEERLPEGIRDLPSFGPYALAWFAGWAMFALFTDRLPIERALLLLIALMIPAGLVLHVWLVGGKGIGINQMVRVALRPPEWWTMYWPRALRRPSDIWSRLPLAARLCRIALSAFFVVVPGAIVVRQLVSLEPGEPLATSLFFLQIGVLAMAVIAVLGAFLWSRNRALNTADTLRLMIGPTSFSAGWSTPNMTRVLAPPPGQVRAPDPSDPADYRRAIRELAPKLPQELHVVGRDALELADRMVDAIERQSGEVNSMQREAAPEESDRLQLRLAALGEASVTDTAQRAELRQLLKNELELLWRMRDRLELATAQRARRFELLRSLYAMLCESCSEGPSSSASGDFSLRAYALCDDLRRELDAEYLT